MSELTSTEINQLPTDPAMGGNVQLNVADSSMPQDGNNAKQMTLDQNTISQIVSGIQQASVSGATQLTSRDIPMDTQQHVRDAETIPNYVPEPKVEHYIDDVDDDINLEYKREQTNSSLDTMYDELQTPLLLAVLYFIFQLPITKQMINKYLHFLCNSDGNYNIYGLLFVCSTFGLIFYSISKSITHFSKF